MIDRETLRQLAILLRPINTRLQNLGARAVVQLVSDGAALQEMQLGVMVDEDIDEAERFQNYGLTSVPLEGAEAVVIFPNGDHGHPLIVAVDDRRYRPTNLEPGEVAVYHKDGAILKFTKDGDIEVTPKSGRQVILAGTAAVVLASSSPIVITAPPGGGACTHNLSKATKVTGS